MNSRQTNQSLPAHSVLTHPKYRADIDGLRAVAVLSVVGFHAFPMWFKGGFIGVDIFFVISGYLISTILFDSLHRERFSFVQFYSHRVKRIFPALLVVLASCYLFGWYGLLEEEYQQLGKHVAGGAGFISNLLLWRESGYFDEAAATKPLLHLWSLGIEEQFYIFWPLILWLAWRRRLNLLTLTILIGLTSFAFNINGDIKNQTAVFYSPHTRFWELLAGSVLAYAMLYRTSKFNGIMQRAETLLSVVFYPPESRLGRNALHNAVSVIGLTLVIIGLSIINTSSIFPGWRAVLPTAGAMLIIAAGAKAWINRKVLSSRILVWFGLISFPLYLWHWPVLSFARIIESEVPRREIRVAAVLLSIILAWLTYQFIEKPIRGGEDSHIRTVILTGLMTALGYAGFTTFTSTGLHARANDQRSKLLNSEAPAFSCNKLFSQFEKFDVCLLSKPFEPTVALVGDSHSGHYYHSFAKALPNLSIINIEHTSCLPFSTEKFHGERNCRENVEVTLAFLREHPTIKTVYLAGYWSYLATCGFAISSDRWRQVDPLKAEETTTFQKDGSFFISTLLTLKKDVVLIRDIPDLDFDVKSCIDSRPLRLTARVNKVCGINKSEFEHRIEVYDRALAGILFKFPEVKTYNPRPIFCTRNLCRAVNDNELMYRNGDHLTIYGADLVVKDLLSKYPPQ